MAKFTDVNNAVASGGESLYLLKGQLVAAGWVVEESGDGISLYGHAGALPKDRITTGASGAAGMNNSGAWYRITDPGSRREYTVQRGAAENEVRIKYSALTKFDEVPAGGGSTDFNTTPYATDQYVLYGGGTDAAPTYTVLFGAGGTYLLHVVAQSTGEGGVYPFWMWSTVNATGATSGVFMCEPLTVGSYPSADTDPCLSVVTSSILTYSYVGGVATFKGWYKMGLGGALFVGMRGYILKDASNNLSYPGLVGTNPYDNDDNGIQILFGRSSTDTTQVGHKGVSKYLKWKGTTKVYPDTLNLASDAYVYVNDVLVPWEDGTAPVL